MFAPSAVIAPRMWNTLRTRNRLIASPLDRCRLTPSVDCGAAAGRSVAGAMDEFLSTRELGWVARWNDRYIGQGKCGPMTKKLHRAFRDRVRAETA